MNHYQEIIRQLCQELAAARDLESMKVAEMQIACAVMLSNGYVFDTASGRYVRERGTI